MWRPPGKILGERVSPNHLRHRRNFVLRNGGVRYASRWGMCDLTRVCQSPFRGTTWRRWQDFLGVPMGIPNPDKYFGRVSVNRPPGINAFWAAMSRNQVTTALVTGSACEQFVQVSRSTWLLVRHSLTDNRLHYTTFAPPYLKLTVT